MYAPDPSERGLILQRCPGPCGDCRQLLAQAEQAIANGGRGIDITDLSDEELIAHLMEKAPTPGESTAKDQPS